MSDKPILYTYFRSSAAYRVRIALAMKGVAYDGVAINLVKGEQKSGEYHDVNPQGRVPSFVHDGRVLTQSMAIMEYLDDVAEPCLVYGDASQKAYIRRLSQMIACDIHPVTNLNVLQYVGAAWGEDARTKWYADFAMAGMAAFEAVLAAEGRAGTYCCGDAVSMADLCLVPQMYNMRRFNLPLDDFPMCVAIERNCVALPAFQVAAPETQPDAPGDLAPIHGPHGIIKQ
jgi:maleylacetoacetate isomerase